MSSVLPTDLQIRLLTSYVSEEFLHKKQVVERSVLQAIASSRRSGLRISEAASGHGGEERSKGAGEKSSEKGVGTEVIGHGDCHRKEAGCDERDACHQDAADGESHEKSSVVKGGRKQGDRVRPSKLKEIQHDGQHDPDHQTGVDECICHFPGLSREGEGEDGMGRKGIPNPSLEEGVTPAVLLTIAKNGGRDGGRVHRHGDSMVMSSEVGQRYESNRNRVADYREGGSSGEAIAIAFNLI